MIWTNIGLISKQYWYFGRYLLNRNSAKRTNLSTNIMLHAHFDINIDINFLVTSVSNSKSISIFWWSQFRIRHQYQYSGILCFKFNININILVASVSSSISISIFWWPQFRIQYQYQYSGCLCFETISIRYRYFGYFPDINFNIHFDSKNIAQVWSEQWYFFKRVVYVINHRWW